MALEARERIDELLSMHTSSSTEEDDGLALSELSEEALASGAVRLKGPEFLSTVTIAELPKAEVVCAVEDLSGRSMKSIRDAVLRADRSLKNADEIVDGIQRLAAFVKDRLPDDAKVLTEKMVLRIGVQAWGNDYGLGVDCIVRRLVQLPQLQIRCTAHTKVYVGELRTVPRTQFTAELVPKPKKPIKRPERRRGLTTRLEAWGENPRCCLGVPEPTVTSPVRLWLPNETVVGIACSPRHTVVVTRSRRVFCCGDNDDGACGVPGHARLDVLTAVALEEIVTVAAGADVFGSSSAAIGKKGELYTWGQGVATGHGTLKPVMEPKRVTRAAEDVVLPKMQQVQLGGAFGVALSLEGHAYAWGLWVDGRLGLGPVPAVSQRRGQKKLASYQLSPKKITGVPRFETIATGEAHALALTDDGQVFGWGLNAYGQLGKDDDRDAPCQCIFSEDEEMLPATEIACGPTHSVIIADGRAFVLGGTGAMRGLGEPSLIVPGLASTTDLMTKRVLERKRGAHGDVAAPREVPLGRKVRRAACGERHTAFVCDDGTLLICGDGLATLGGTATGDLVFKDSEEEILTKTRDLAIVRIPREPNPRWLPELQGVTIDQIACAGQHTLVVTSTPTAAERLGRSLLLKAQDAAEFVEKSDEDDVASVLVRRYGVDCVLVPGGGAPVYAHQAILACRSSLMAELILQERREDGTDAGELLQILVPDLSPAVLTAVIEYLYCDDIFDAVHPTLGREIAEAAERYGVSRLAHICRSSLVEEDDVPASTLAVDLASLVGDGSFSDATVVADGRPIAAHRVVLEETPYFRAMFQSGMQEAAKVQVHVPDDFDGTRRLLTHLYAGILPDAPTSRLLNDLLSADRYGLTTMGFACESALATTTCSGVLFDADDEPTCIDSLRIAAAVKADRLLREATAFLLSHLDDPAISKALPDLLNDAPSDLKHRLLDALFHQRSLHASLAQDDDDDDNNAKDEKTSFLTIRPNTIMLPHAIALLVLSVVSLWFQQLFRLRTYAVAVINAAFLALFVSVFWHARSTASATTESPPLDNDDDEVK